MRGPEAAKTRDDFSIHLLVEKMRRVADAREELGEWVMPEILREAADRIEVLLAHVDLVPMLKFSEEIALVEKFCEHCEKRWPCEVVLAAMEEKR